MTNEIMNEFAIPEGQQAAHSVPTEKMIPQSQVNNIVREKINDAHTKGYQKAIAEMQQTPVQNANAHHSLSNHEDVHKIAAEAAANELKKQIDVLQRQHQAAEKAAAEKAAMQVALDFKAKLDAGGQAIPDFAKTMSNVAWNSPHYENILNIANRFDNPALLLHHLSQNPEKIGILNGLDPHTAFNVANRLMQSLAQNKAGENIQFPSEPLEQPQPSNVVGKKPNTFEEKVAAIKNSSGNLYR